MRTTLAIATVALVFMPPGFFDSFADAEWEVGIVRLAASVLLAIVGVWSWVSQTGGGALTRFNGWVSPGMGLLAVYLLSSNPLFLILGFSTLFAGAADLWLLRAHTAAESLRFELESRTRRRPPGN